MEDKPEIIKNTLKIIEPIKIDVKTFQNEKEFEDYYNLNKKSLEDSTTTRLNRMFKIPGYRITRIKNELCLKKDYVKKDESPKEDIKDFTQDIDEIKTSIDELKHTIAKINIKLGKYEKAINNHSEVLNRLL